MSTVQYSPSSPYFNTPQSSFFLDVWEKREIPVLETDLEVTVISKYNLRPDLLSNDLYGTPKFWWVFAVRNPDIIKDPIYDMVSGIQIFATEKNDLLDILNA